MGAFASGAFFSKMVQPAPQEDASATEALSTKDIHQGLCFQVLLVADASVCGSGWDCCESGQVWELDLAVQVQGKTQMAKIVVVMLQ